MLFQEYKDLQKKLVEAAPDWLKDDIQNIINKAGAHTGISLVISQLHETYSFGLKHILSATFFSDEWTRVSRERLSFIDNNIEVIVALYYDIKGQG